MPSGVNHDRFTAEERTRQLEIGVGEDREWQAEPLGKLLLIGGLLRRKANDLRACLDQLLVMIAKGTRLGRAATCARNEVPTRRQVRFARTARPRIGVDHRSSAPKPGKGDGVPVSRGKRDLRHSHAAEMGRGAIVNRNGQVRWQRVWIPHAVSVRVEMTNKYGSRWWQTTRT